MTEAERKKKEREEKRKLRQKQIEEKRANKQKLGKTKTYAVLNLIISFNFENTLYFFYFLHNLKL